MELHSLLGWERVALHNGATRGISSHEHSNEEVAAIKLLFVLVDDPSHQRLSVTGPDLPVRFRR